MKSGKSIFIVFVSASLLLFSTIEAVSAHSRLQNDANTTRIVSAGGSVTEILYALGIEQQIVAVDTSSMYPLNVSQVPKVGYFRQLSVEGVLAMQPTHLFGAVGSGPSQVLAQLENAGVIVHIFDHPRTVAGLLKLIREIGDRAGLRTKAEQLAQQVSKQLSKIKQLGANNQQRAVFLMSVGDRGIMAAGNNTVPNLIMNIVGLDNPYQNIEGFKPVSIESFLAIAPTQVLLAAHRTGGLSAMQLCAHPALAQWASTQGCNLHIVDTLLFLGLTPRLPQAVDQFTKIVKHKNDK